MTDQEHAKAIAQSAAQHATTLIDLFGEKCGLFSVVGASTDGRHGLVIICNEAEGVQVLLEVVEAYQADRNVTSINGEVRVREARGETH
jgi:pyruvate/2-oxoglutarate/acetoin dehydrogenase E1 component